MTFGGVFAVTACSLAGGFDGFTDDPNVGAEGGIEGPRPPTKVKSGSDSGFEPLESGVTVAECNQPGVFCDGFERTNPVGRWSGTTSTGSGSNSIVSSPPPPEGLRFAEFSIAAQPIEDAGTKANTYLYYEKRSSRQVYYRSRVRLDRRPSSGEYGQILSVVVNDGMRDTGLVGVAMTAGTTILNFSSSPPDAGMPVFSNAKTEPWPVDVWSLLELTVDLSLLTASLKVDGQAATTITLHDVAPGMVTVAVGLPYYDADRGHPEFHVQVDDVLLKMTE